MAYKDLKPGRGQEAGKNQYALPQKTKGRQFTGGSSVTKPATITVTDKAALPILANPEMEQKLVKHILDRLRLSDQERAWRTQRMVDIDIQLSGFIRHDRDDAKRDRDNKRGKSPKPTKHNLPLADAQLDEANTYLLSVFAPDMDIFEATSRADKQAVAKGLTEYINRNGQSAQYYREFSKMLGNALKYNLGGMYCAWEKHMGVTFAKTAGGQLSKKPGVVWEGNVLKSFDMYNFLYDTSVHPVDLPKKGEYFAEVCIKTPFRIKKMADDKQLFGVDRFVGENRQVQAQPTAPGSGVSSDQIYFYMQPPEVRDGTAQPIGARTNWKQTLSDGGPAKDSEPTQELVYFTGWLCPNDFGLSKSKNLEIWRITLANGKFIANGVQLEDSHGMLPCGMASPIEDDLNNDQRTYAEKLLPLQHFASFLLNTHQDATRKSIYGITVFNAHAFPGLDKSEDELIGAKIPMRSSASEIDIDKIFRHYTDVPNTDQNVTMIGNIEQIMQKILPTNQAQQVADLERATTYQAAATVQASNRRNLKIARIISDQALQPIKFQMTYNIYANVTSIEYVDEAGQVQTISPSDLIDADIEFDVGTGLKGIDRLIQMQVMKEILTACLQSQQAIQELDIVALLNYIASIAGERTDLAQFRRQQPLPAQPPAPGNAQVPPATGETGAGSAPAAS